jgi:hypothetical protein
MAISDDLKSLHVALADAPNRSATDMAPFMRMVCANLLALADQVEALERMPLHADCIGVPARIRPAPLQ